jgi:hypothetical protein
MMGDSDGKILVYDYVESERIPCDRQTSRCCHDDANYFTENIIGTLEETIFPDGRAAHGRRLVVRMNNAPVHNCGMTTNFLADHNMVRLRHPPYSPDLAPNDFYLFPTVEEKLKEVEMVDEEDCPIGCRNF